jgi:hypothetical protein
MINYKNCFWFIIIIIIIITLDSNFFFYKKRISLGRKELGWAPKSLYYLGIRNKKMFEPRLRGMTSSPTLYVKQFFQWK